MRKLVILALAVFFCVGSAVELVAEDSLVNIQRADHPAYVPGELLVKYKQSVLAGAVEYYKGQWNIETVQILHDGGVHRVRLPEELTVEEAIWIYGMDQDVIYAEPNYYCYIELTPNDTHYSKLWGLHNTGQNVNGTSGTPDADIDAPEAWNLSTGSSNVIVAVIDTGVDQYHPDLAANIWLNPGEIAGNGIDDDGNGYVDDINGWDFVDNDNTPIDSNGHGSHVAGTIAAVGNNAEGIVGVNWTAGIMVLRCFDALGMGPVSEAVPAIQYATEKGAHVINCSWRLGGYSQALKDAIDACPALVVCSAGNSGTDNDITPHYPSCYTSPNIIAVAATDQDDALTSFSNYGFESVDVAAPGINIYSCQPGRQTVWTDDFDDGTINDWTTGGANNTWGLTSSQSYSGSYSLTDSPAGNYQNNTNSWARTPVIDLSLHTDPLLKFVLKGSSESGYDGLLVQTSTNMSTWVNRNIEIGGMIYSGISGTAPNWIGATVDLKDLEGNSTCYIRFNFTSDGSVTADGWYIDDVDVTSASTVYDGTEFAYYAGTSMAAPHVSGVAALVKAHKPSLSATQVRATIEGSVDTEASLAGKIATGGRINAYSALVALIPQLPIVTTSPADSITSNSARLRGTVNPNGLDTTYYFEYGLTNGYGKTTQAKNAGSGATAVDVWESVYGLDQGTYHFRLVAMNSAGINYGIDLTFTTSTTGPPPADGDGCFISTVR